MRPILREIPLDKGFFWSCKDTIPFDHKQESFYDYLTKEKSTLDKHRPRRTLLQVLGLVSILLILLISSVITFFDSIILFFVEGVFIGPQEVQSELFSLMIIASLLASILGQILAIATLSFKFFFTQKHWSSFHDQTLALVKRLTDAGIIENFIQYESEKKRFKLTKVSIDFQIQWIFPFLFLEFPPLLFEVLLLSFLLPFSIATIVSLIAAYFSSDILTIIISVALLALIVFGIFNSTFTIAKLWLNYHKLHKSMVNRQEELIHSLVLNSADDLTILRNEKNLDRLKSMHPFPLPAIFRLTAIIPLIGSLIGYIVGITLLV